MLEGATVESVRRSPRKHPEPADTESAAVGGPSKRSKTQDPVGSLLLLRDPEPDPALREKAAKCERANWPVACCTGPAVPRCLRPACFLNVGFRLRAHAADLERCEQRLGAARYGEWLAVLTAHDLGSIDTTEAVERAKTALSIGANHSLVLQLNSFLPPDLRVSPLQMMMKNPKATAAAPSAPAAAAPAAAPATAPAATSANGDPDDMLAHFTEPGWRAALSREMEKPYFKRIVEHVTAERRSKKIFPPAAEVFSAFNYTPYVLQNLR